MSQGSIRVAPDNVAGKAVDTSELLLPDGTQVQRQRVAIGDPHDAALLAGVTDRPTAGTETGMVVREADPSARDLLEALLAVQEMMLGRLPMPDAFGRMRATIDTASSAGRYPMVYNADGGGSFYQSSLTPFHLSASASAGLYQQLIVS